MKKRLKIILASVVAFLVSILIFIGNFFYGESVKRGSEVELHREVEAVNAVAETDSSDLLSTAKAWYEDQTPIRLTQNAYDDLLLQADYINNENDSSKTVILVHGFRKEKADMGNYTKFYYDQGYNILMPDSRGHGESEGDYYGYGWHDRHDLIGWIDLLISEYGTKEIVLHGNSAGAAAVLMTSGEVLPDQVKAIIADSGFTSVKDELKHQLKHIYGLPSFPLLDITSVITKVRAGYFFEEASSIEQVKKNKLPLLIIHGEADDLVPTWMGKEIYQAAGGEKELWLVPDVGHIKAYEIETAMFEERVKEFLSKI
ncbi:alpha/beta hydrolase [Pseudogracilibacillus sp. SE30717A]|uniref:alpha/beta hydrolase n=1 Tax=Pseudogracilibacillus sp. SE30717A TaxID=3098293 RepID=UPI00300DCE31